MKLMIFFSLLVGLVSAEMNNGTMDQSADIIYHYYLDPTEEPKILKELTTGEPPVLENLIDFEDQKKLIEALNAVAGEPPVNENPIGHDLNETASQNEEPAINITENRGNYHNKWSPWNLEVLKSKMDPLLKPTKASVTAILDELSSARLELLRLQQEIAMEEHYFVKKEHELKMTHLNNEENRKEELYNLKLRSMPQKDVS